MQREQRSNQHAGAREQYERGGDLGDGKGTLAVAGTTGDADVAARQIHWFIAGGGGPGTRGGTARSAASQITAWVEAHFSEKTIGGVTVYDLTSPTS